MDKSFKFTKQEYSEENNNMLKEVIPKIIE